MEDNKNPFKEEELKEENKQSQEETNEVSCDEQKEVQEENNQVNEETNEVDELNKKYEDLNNKYIRLAADFDNFRKRTIQEKEDLSKYACCELLKKLSTVIDTFERANEQLKEIEDCTKIKEGYDVIYKQFIDTLKKIGMEEIECLGKEFNPNEHEAITQIPTNDYEADCVACVMQKGYKFQDKLIRPALVGVAIKKEDE